MLQHLIVLTLVAACVTYLGRGFVRTLAAKRTQFGKCCAAGCRSATNEPTVKREGGSGDRVMFIPVESLKRRRT